MLSRFERELKDCEMKKILITGADSYIGTSFETWLAQPKFKGLYEVDTIDMRKEGWKEKDFSPYDAVFHVAGIAHVDIKKITEEGKKLYYRVNRDLAFATAEKARDSGVRQFIYMSSLIVYKNADSIRKKQVITEKTRPDPENFYGDSKWQAEKYIKELDSKEFRVAILRPPMIYGRGCKGNYRLLSKLAQTTPAFPDIDNERSMLYIGNLCEFVRLLVEKGASGIYFPQNAEYTKTSEIVREIAKVHHKRVWITKSGNPFIYLLSLFPGRIGKMVNKAFGSLICEKSMSRYPDFEYQIYNLRESIKETESQDA